MWLKARHRRLKAFFKRRGEIGQDREGWWPISERADRIMTASGKAMIRAAQNRAAGL